MVWLVEVDESGQNGSRETVGSLGLLEMLF